jgi:hypothetical protein
LKEVKIAEHVANPRSRLTDDSKDDGAVGDRPGRLERAEQVSTLGFIGRSPPVGSLNVRKIERRNAVITSTARAHESSVFIEDSPTNGVATTCFFDELLVNVDPLSY